MSAQRGRRWWWVVGLGLWAASAQAEPTAPGAAQGAEAAPGPEVMTAQLVALTEGFYDAAAARAGDCGALTDALGAYLDANSAAWAALVVDLKGALKAGALDPTALAEAMRASLDESPRIKPGQDAIYACAKAREAQGRKRPLSKLMQRLFDLHEPLLREVMGPLEKDER